LLRTKTVRMAVTLASAGHMLQLMVGQKIAGNRRIHIGSGKGMVPQTSAFQPLQKPWMLVMPHQIVELLPLKVMLAMGAIELLMEVQHGIFGQIGSATASGPGHARVVQDKVSA